MIQFYTPIAPTGLVSTQRAIWNEEGVVPGFWAAELDDPWTALEKGQGLVVQGEGEKDVPQRLFPELGACEEVRS